MIDFSKQKINGNCPECNYKFVIELKQVEQQETIICRSCKQGIKLIDKGGSTKKGLRDMNKSMKELEKVLKGFGKLK